MTDDTETHVETDEAVRKKSKEEYLILLELFKTLIDRIESGSIGWDELENLIERRVTFILGHAFAGFGMDMETALHLLRKHDNRDLTPVEREQRDVLVAAVDNLIDFVAAEEYQMSAELPDEVYYDEEEDELNEDTEEVFERYNGRYASRENMDVFFAMACAASFIALPELATLTYMTQGDERVRETHRSLEGLTFRKGSIPDWLIPPIDWGCRCYLDETYSAPSDLNDEDMEQLSVVCNPVFRESVVRGGDLFSSEHRYFSMSEDAATALRKICRSIKSKFNL